MRPFVGRVYKGSNPLRHLFGKFDAFRAYSVMNAVKSLVEMAETWQDADKILDEYSGAKTRRDKLQYLRDAFPDVGAVGRELSEDDYVAVLDAVVNKKWR